MKVDKIAPVCHIENLPIYINSTSFTVSWNGYDEISGININSFDIQYKLNSNQWIDWLVSTDKTNSTFGPNIPTNVTDTNIYSFRCRVKDIAGNISIYPDDNNPVITIDTSPPNITLITSPSHPQDVWKNSSDISISWISNDVTSGVKGFSYALSNNPTYIPDSLIDTSNNSIILQNIADGIWYFHIRALDNAGNWGDEITYGPIKIDTSYPQLITTLSKEIIKKEELIININSNESLKEISAYITQNGADSIPLLITKLNDTTWTTSYTPLTNHDGTAILNITAKDLAENTTNYFKSFIVDTTSPTAIITINPQPPLKTGKIEINLNINDITDIILTPSLKILLPDGKLISLNLTGSNKNWYSNFYIESTTQEGLAYFIFSATDTALNNGNQVIEGENFLIDTTINQTIGGTSSNSDNTFIYIPPFSSLEPININIITISSDTHPIPQANNKLSNIIKPLNTYKKVIAKGDISGSDIKIFQKDITLSIPYKDENQDGYVDGSNIHEKTLRIFHLNEINQEWEEVPTSQVIENENRVIASINSLSIYAIFSYLLSNNTYDNIIAFPNPCYMKKDKYLNITNIPNLENLKIYIYNIAGDLVRTLDNTNEIIPQFGVFTGKWDGLNERGEKVASGIYIYVVKDKNKIIKKEKVAVFW